MAMSAPPVLAARATSAGAEQSEARIGPQAAAGLIGPEADQVRDTAPAGSVEGEVWLQPSPSGPFADRAPGARPGQFHTAAGIRRLVELRRSRRGDREGYGLTSARAEIGDHCGGGEQDGRP